MPSHHVAEGITRRAFLGAAIASAGALAAGSRITATAEAVTTRYPLYVPPTVNIADLQSAFALTAKASTVDLGGSALSDAWVYNDFMPGPTFRARRGDRALITLRNRLSEETITHWHGMLVSHENDGHPILAVQPGADYRYDFPVQQRAALNWYHPHPDMRTGKQVALGLAGAFIVNDAEEDALGLPSGRYELPLVVRDSKLDRAGNLMYRPKSGGFTGDLPLVNGTRDPYVNVDTALYRLRFLNGANARIFRLSLSSGAPFTLIGNDGGLLAKAKAITAITLAPGERLDLLVDFRTLSVGERVMLRDLRAGWDLLEFVVTRAVTVPGTIPTTLSTIVPLTSPVRTRDFSFDGMSRINGLEYDLHRVDFRVPFGQTERWRFRTSGNAPHPVHVHGASFKVVSRSGGRGRTYPWEQGWKDTVLLEDGETVEIFVRFEAYRGLYVMHCHKLEHEDMGMMSNFEVF